MALHLKKRCFAYVEPLWYLTIALYGCLFALLRIAWHNPSGLFNLPNLKDAVFAQFWQRMGPMFAKGDEETAVPGLVSEASGIVLELGPGIGSQLPRYDTSKLTKVYGVEPNIHLHKALREKAKAGGLTDIYEIVPCGIEDTAELEKHGIAVESVDTVLSIQVLCSVPNPDVTLRRLYALMKPGARLVVYEHVQSNDEISRLTQNCYNIFWPSFIGNCHLNRNTHQSVMQAGNWKRIELTIPTLEDAWALFPRIHGRLWKEE